ncbi:uncharacterized protein LOC126484691 [Schistocerca serialis cubense]|uniref:uncharacterized protein LOC126484691 n=1 Tax=Schistocerca serialis cubense TaxID=2023355 RepID=UPI00214F5AFD|nr:uncharacterized protein LOC126484691 [Schistocerca serialis cubense]
MFYASISAYITKVCGISDNIFHLLKQKVQHISDNDKLVNMSLDEMSLMANLTYDSTSDTVIGFEDFRFARTAKIANSVLVIMINGIFLCFKQPLLYYFCKGTVGAMHLTAIFYEVVKRLKEIGLVVKTCVTDQGSNFVDWRKRLGITQDNPILVYEEQKIYFFYDTPHLFKSIRNNLFRYDIIHTSNDGLVGTASWKDISQLYSNDLHRKYKLAPKLTKKVVELPAFSKMKVGTAVRVLSHTVAAGIDTLVFCGSMPLSATGTSDFCQKVNDIFDIFNTYSVKGPVHLRNCIRSDSEHLDVLHVTKPWIHSWKFVGSDGKDYSLGIKCVKGLLSNICAFEMLAAEVLTGTKLYLFSCKINQDTL